MDRVMEIKLAKDKMTAVLDVNEQEALSPISIEELKGFLVENKITYGVKTDVLEQIANDPDSIEFPVLIAEGTASVNGEDAYLRNEIKEANSPVGRKFNFRDVLNIPSVTKGQLLATEIPPGLGVNGIDVTGGTTPAKSGRPLKLKAGNNVLNQSGKFYSMLDGQVSITSQSISVNPVFEVKGDLDLKTGNIDFIGNIIIKGNVPSGYELKAGGDIRVNGMVEAANLVANGNIIIQGGIAGGMKGNITAEGNVHVNYLNQAIVKAGNDIIVKASILHSRVTAGGNLDCKSATVIGGTITAGRNIHVKDLGNELYTKSELAIGWDPAIEKKEQDTLALIETIKENNRKLSEIETKLLQLSKQAGRMTDEMKKMVQKEQTTIKNNEKHLNELQEELALLQLDKKDRLNSSLFVYDKVFPNTMLYFGKYAQMTNQLYKKVFFRLENSEIRVYPFQETEKAYH